MMEAMTGSDGAALSGDAFWRSPGAAAPAAAQALRAQRTPSGDRVAGPGLWRDEADRGGLADPPLEVPPQPAPAY